MDNLSILKDYGIVIPPSDLTKLPAEPADKAKDEKKEDEGGDGAT